MTIANPFDFTGKTSCWPVQRAPRKADHAGVREGGREYRGLRAQRTRAERTRPGVDGCAAG